MGILADSKELPKNIPQDVADSKEAPCMVIGKLGRNGKLQRLTVIDLNQEGLIDIGSTKVLLKESVDLFKNQLGQDTRFIEDYNRKVDMRRMTVQNPQQYAPTDAEIRQMQAMMGNMGGEDPMEQEYQKQEELRKKQQLERERK